MIGKAPDAQVHMPGMPTIKSRLSYLTSGLAAGLLSLSICAEATSTTPDQAAHDNDTYADAILEIQPYSIPEISDRAKDRYEQAFNRGKESAAADWANGQAKIMVFETTNTSRFDPDTGMKIVNPRFDPATGMGIEYFGFCRLTLEMAAGVYGYNQYLVEQIREHGLPDNNRLRWAAQINNPSLAFAENQDAKAIEIGDPAIEGPDSNKIRWVTDRESNKDVLLYSDPEGNELWRSRWPSTMFSPQSVSIAYGPEGSEVLFAHFAAPQDVKYGDVYITLDLRNGRDLIRQHEIKPTPHNPKAQ